MPELPFDFSSIQDRQRFAICLIEENGGDINKGMIQAGYKDTNPVQQKITYKRLLKKEDVQKYIQHLKNHPTFLKEELEWFRRDPSIPVNKSTELSVPTHLSEENKSFLENYFILGDKFKAMKETFPEEGYNEVNKAIALRKASNILKNVSSIEYMNMLNDRALQEIFLSKSKVILEVYELAKECKDSKSRFAAVKAYELLARMTGLLQDNKSVSINDVGKIEINYIVPDKLDTNIHKDINDFLEENYTSLQEGDIKINDVEYNKYEQEDGDVDGK